MTDHDDHQAELISRLRPLLHRLGPDVTGRDLAAIHDLLEQLDWRRRPEPAVVVDHRQALADAGRIMLTVRCGRAGCDRSVAVIRSTPHGPLWISKTDIDANADMWRPPDFDGRVPPTRTIHLWLLDYPEPADHDPLTEWWWRRIYPPTASCPKHGRLDVDPDDIRAAVRDHPRTRYVLDHRRN